MDGDFTIGELARRTGLTVKAIRFYSDRGIVPPTGRSPAGYRLYDRHAAARLDLVRTLRELDLDLPTIRRVLDRELTLAEVAAAHAEALAARIGVLRLRRAVLLGVAERGVGPEEVGALHELATLSEAGRKRLVDEFLEGAFGDLAADPAFAGIVRTMTPELPEHPGIDQVEAWVELAGLTRDPDFRAYVRRLAEYHGAVVGDVTRPDPAAVVRAGLRVAVADGVSPGSVEGGVVVSEVLGRLPEVPVGRLAALVEMANDPRRERYLRLLAVVNGWRAPESSAPAFDWFLRALRAHEVVAASVG
ncbi:MAG: MerR family transcriptional regulator [Saccharothrix sp.]|nr:MerR family transcriptional regulator [Saccharothrix sp.]